MKTLHEIEEQAKESYETYFKEVPNVVNKDCRGQDIILDKDKLENEMNMKKEDEMKKIESLEVLRNHLNIEAKTAYENTFGKGKTFSSTKKMNTQDMYKKLTDERDALINKMSSLKQQQMMK